MGRGNLLDVLEAALGLTLLIVGFGLAWRAFTGNRLGSAWLVQAGEPIPPSEPSEEAAEPAAEPQWFHRLYTLVMGTLLAALGVLVLSLIFFTF